MVSRGRDILTEYRRYFIVSSKTQASSKKGQGLQAQASSNMLQPKLPLGLPHRSRQTKQHSPSEEQKQGMLQQIFQPVQLPPFQPQPPLGGEDPRLPIRG